MSSAQGYAESLSDNPHKGQLNLKNIPDIAPSILHKSRLLAETIRSSSHVVVHTGAGISTSAGISDFRGPDGVWTTQSRPSKRPRRTTPFHRAIPTLTHMALVALHHAHHINYVISQNVDSLHLRSGLPRASLSELHGNIFVEHCPECHVDHLRDTPAPTVGLRQTGNFCPCGAALTDRALDWDDPLPEHDFDRAKHHAARADLNIVLGTSCQMEPARGLPFRGKRGKAAVVLVNLSETPFDHRFGFRIRAKCDTVFAIVATVLGLQLDVFERRVPVCFDHTWLDRGLAKCVMRRADGAVVDGVRAVRYGDTPAAGDAFEATVTAIPVEAVVELDDGRVQTLRSDEDEAQLVLHRRDWNAHVARLEEQLVTEARRYEGELDASQFFVTGERRGWAVCCMCRAEVWCTRGKRDAHLRDCLRRKRT